MDQLWEPETSRIGVMRTPNRHVVPHFNPGRKDTHWAKRKLKRAQNSRERCRFENSNSFQMCLLSDSHSSIHHLRSVHCHEICRDIMKSGFSVQSLGVALLGAGLLSGTAFAADLPLKALPPLPPAFSWTGFYVGAHAGYGWSDADVTLASVATPTSQFTGIFADASANATPSILNTHPGGFIGGGQFGYNYQISKWVWGYEADLSWADFRGSDTRRGTAGVVGSPGTTPADITAVGEQKLNFFGTVRGKLGFTPVDSLLVYATGGLAYGHVESSTNTSDIIGSFSTGPASGSASAVRAGWTAGGGIETALAFAPRWSLKAEYLHYDLGHLTYALSPAPVFIGNQSLGLVNTTATTHFQGNLVRVGLNYTIH